MKQFCYSRLCQNLHTKLLLIAVIKSHTFFAFWTLHGRIRLTSFRLRLLNLILVRYFFVPTKPHFNCKYALPKLLVLNLIMKLTESDLHRFSYFKIMRQNWYLLFSWKRNMKRGEKCPVVMRFLELWHVSKWTRSKFAINV